MQRAGEMRSAVVGYLSQTVTLIVAGSISSGKTTLITQLIQEFPRLKVISPDVSRRARAVTERVRVKTFQELRQSLKGDFEPWNPVFFVYHMGTGRLLGAREALAEFDSKDVDKSQFRVFKALDFLAIEAWDRIPILGCLPSHINFFLDFLPRAVCVHIWVPAQVARERLERRRKLQQVSSRPTREFTRLMLEYKRGEFERPAHPSRRYLFLDNSQELAPGESPDAVRLPAEMIKQVLSLLPEEIKD